MPKKPQRTITRSLRFTAEEWATVAGKLAGRDFSGAVRALLLDAAIPEAKNPVRVQIQRRHMSQAEAAQVRQLAWIGNNLNQIAKATNMKAGGAAILAQLVSLEREIRRQANVR